MHRRHLLAAAGSALAAPAVAQTSSDLRWRMAVAPSPDLLAVAASDFAGAVADATDGRLQIRIVPPAEAGPADGLLDAVAAGTLDLVYGPPDIAFAKDPVFGLLTSVPFGLNTRGTAAWFMDGGGLDLANVALASMGLRMLVGGNTGARPGGWFRREPTRPEDLRGLKIRATGLAASVLSRLGAEPQAMPLSAVREALTAGTLDATTSVGPYEDERLDVGKAAPFYAYPGWQEPSATMAFTLSDRRWAQSTKSQRAALEGAAALTATRLLARCDARNPAALRRLVGGGAKLTPFGQPLLDAAFKASGEVLDDLAGRHAHVRAIWDSMRTFRNEEYLWFQVNEYTFDNFMIRARARGLP